MQALKSLSISMECESGWNTFHIFGSYLNKYQLLFYNQSLFVDNFT